MAKIKACIVAFLILIICTSAFGQRNRIIKIAYSQLGVHEATGNNDGIAVEKYLRSCGLGKGYPWCAAYVNWVFKEADLNGPRYPARAASWFNQYLVAKAYAQPSDLGALYYRRLGRIGHIFIIDRSPPGQYFFTIEGNTNKAGSREGDGVYRKRRLKKQTYKISRWVK